MINGSYNKLGYYDTQSDNLTWMDMEKWAGHKVRNNKTKKFPLIKKKLS